MRLVLRASSNRLLHRENANFIREKLPIISKRWAVRVYEFSNNGNHLHLLMRAKSRRGFQAFLRGFAGTVAMKVMGSAKGRPGHFWSKTAYTRLLEWGRAFLSARRYVVQNQLEASGVIPYQPRSKRKTKPP